MRLRYLVIAGHYKTELEVENYLVLREHVDRIIERFGPIDLLVRL